MPTTWNILKATMCGSAHAKEGRECQDFVSARASDRLACVVVADGAGSARHAQAGAELVAREATSLLSTFDLQHKYITLLDLHPEELASYIIDGLRRSLSAKAGELHCEVGELASTLMFFVSDGGRYVAGNLGDGLVGCINASGAGQIVLPPEHGPFVNQSYFVTDANCLSHLRLAQGRLAAGDVFFCLTDGSVDCLYNRSSKAFAPMLATFCSWMRRYAYTQIHPMVKAAMHKFFPLNTKDDCAIGLVTAK